MAEKLGETARPELVDQSDKELFEQLYIEAFEVRRRLDLDRGWLIFSVDQPPYTRVDVTASAYDDMTVTLYQNFDGTLNTYDGTPYLFQRQVGFSRKAGGNMQYSIYDQARYPTRWDGKDHDSELDTDDGTTDFSEPLPPLIRAQLEQALAMLPTLRREQFIEEESEFWFDETKYDRRAQTELKELEQALSTAGGALYLMQLMIIARKKESGRRGNVFDFTLGSTHKSQIRAVFERPRGSRDRWHPQYIEYITNALGGDLRTQNGRIGHRIEHRFSGDESSVDYTVSDILAVPNFNLCIDASQQSFEPDQKLPPALHSLVKHLLNSIATADVSKLAQKPKV